MYLSVVVHIFDSLVQFLHSIAVLSGNKRLLAKRRRIEVLQSSIWKFYFKSFMFVLPLSKVGRQRWSTDLYIISQSEAMTVKLLANRRRGVYHPFCIVMTACFIIDQKTMNIAWYRDTDIQHHRHSHVMPLPEQSVTLAPMETQIKYCQAQVKIHYKSW